VTSSFLQTVYSLSGHNTYATDDRQTDTTL